MPSQDFPTSHQDLSMTNIGVIRCQKHSHNRTDYG
jgi:hypothetical protein